MSTNPTEPTQIARDPFGRRTLMRRIVNLPSCSNCGGHRTIRHNPAGLVKDTAGLFQYAWVADGLNTKAHWDNKAYCSKSCWASYHG